MCSGLERAYEWAVRERVRVVRNRALNGYVIGL